MYQCKDEHMSPGRNGKTQDKLPVGKTNKQTNKQSGLK